MTLLLVVLAIVTAADATAADATAEAGLADSLALPPGLNLPLLNGSPLRFNVSAAAAAACSGGFGGGRVTTALLAAPTLGLGAFTVAWQPSGRQHLVMFSQPGRDLADACRLLLPMAAANVDHGSLLVSVDLADNGTVAVEVGGGGGGSVCRFSAAGAGAEALVGIGDHFLAVGPFDGCVEVGGGGVGGGRVRHCFAGGGGVGCHTGGSSSSSLPPEGREFAHRRVRRAVCSPSNCTNNGTCNRFTDNPICICPLPFIPPYCSAYANYCNQLQPDINVTSLPVCINGSCSVSLDAPYFRCSCVPGYEGNRCQAEVNECAPRPCGNNGQCSDRLNNFTCSCYSGWQGRNCDVNIDDCTASVCSSRDRCVDGNSTCYCKQGWRGSNCSQVDHCAGGGGVACPNATACVNLEPSGFECRGAVTFSHQLTTPESEPSLRLSPAGGLSEPLATVVGRARARRLAATAANSSANSSSAAASTMPSQLLTVARGDRQLIVSLSTVDGQLTVSLDNQTATVSVNASLATGEFFAFNVTAEPGFPLTLSVAMGNESATGESSGALSNASILMLDSVAMVTLGAGFKGCLEDARLNSLLLPLVSNWTLAAGQQPGFIWLAALENSTARPPPLIGCLGDPVCQPGPCLNSGQCRDLWNWPSCQCPAGYSGPTCGVVNCTIVACGGGGGVATAGVSTTVVVVLCVLALLVVIVVITVVLVKLARNRRSETGQYKPSKEESSHDRPGNGVREPDTDLDDNFVLGNLQVARL